MVKKIISRARSEFRHLFHLLNPASRRGVKRWELVEGPEFLRRIGVKSGDRVMDFGCGPGSFCLPAARVVGNAGCVFAVDRNRRALSKVSRRAERMGFRNISVFTNIAAALARFDGRRFDCVLLYDMLHFLDKSERHGVYRDLHMALADDGFVSVHMTHVKGNDPGGHFADMAAEDVVREIEAAGYSLSQKFPANVWHSYNTVDSLVWHFVQS